MSMNYTSLHLLLFLICEIFNLKIFAQPLTPVGRVLSGSQYVMIWHQSEWNKEVVKPLAPIYAGDSVKVKQEADAKVILILKGINNVMLKFGDPTYYIMPVEPTKPATPNSNGKRSFLFYLKNALIDNGPIAIIPAVSRGIPSRDPASLIISPKDTYVLPLQEIKFEWYSDSLHQYVIDIRDVETKKVIFKQENNSRTVTMAIHSPFRLQPGKRYHWSVSNGKSRLDSAFFEVAADTMAQRITRQLHEIEMGFHHENMRLQILLMQAAWLQRERFHYDARRILYEAVQEQPENTEIRQLFEYTTN